MAGVSKVDKSLKDFINSTLQNNSNSEKENDKILYTFLRNYTINYFNSDKNKSLKENFLDYIYTGKSEKNGEEKKINIEMDEGNIYQKENSQGMEVSTVVSLLDSKNPLIHEVENGKKYMLSGNHSARSKRMAIFDILSDAAYTNELWKINEEINNYQLRYNGLTLKENIEYSNAKIRENIYEILGNGKNVKNNIVRDASKKAIFKSTVQILKATKKVEKSERNNYLVEAIERLQDKRDEEEYEKTMLVQGDKEYEISQEEEMIASFPYLLDIYPALRYKYNNDGTKKNIVQEVKYGINKINEMNDRTNGENDEQLEGKENQVYDLINSDFILALSKSEDKEKFMKYFVSSVGLSNSKEYLKQIQEWQATKEEIQEKEVKELENSLEVNRKIISENTDLEKADDFINEVAKDLYQYEKRKINIRYINKDTDIEMTETVEDYPEEKSLSEIHIDFNNYIGKEDNYIISDEKLEKIEAEETTNQQKKREIAKDLYNYKKDKAIKTDPQVAQREKLVVDNMKAKIKENKKEKVYSNELVSDADKKTDIKKSSKNDRYKKDKIDDTKNDNKEEKIENNRIQIEGYKTGKYAQNKYEENGQMKIEFEDNTKVEKIQYNPDDFKTSEVFESKISNTFEEITKENQMDLDEWEEEKQRQENSSLQKEEAEYKGIEDLGEKITYLEEHKDLRDKMLYDLLKIREEFENKKEKLEEVKIRKEQTDELEQNISQLYKNVIERAGKSI